GQATLRPSKSFDPVGDAATLKSCMVGLGTDEQPMIDILAHRTNSERQEISSSYKTQFEQELIDDLRNELSGDFESTLVALLTPIADFLATELNALSGLETKEDHLIEMLCTRCNDEVVTIIEAYERYLTKTEREEDPADPEQAIIDAEALQSNMKDLGTENCALNSIMSSRSYDHLRMVFWEYKRLTGQSILSAIDSELSGDLRAGMLSFVKCVENMPRYFAEKLHQAIQGVGTDDQVLIRIVATRCEIDMKKIKRQYQKLYQNSLEEAIVNDTSGNYRTLLVTLIEDM
ncbi:annexin-B12-like, partial [Limulus polyphemus]|uniref:Annexin n=1 Tax=Limulus polyphemus TaxID=6850 RepID=A0ABM1SK89_LIMPO